MVPNNYGKMKIVVPVLSALFCWTAVFIALSIFGGFFFLICGLLFRLLSRSRWPGTPLPLTANTTLTNDRLPRHSGGGGDFESRSPHGCHVHPQIMPPTTVTGLWEEMTLPPGELSPSLRAASRGAASPAQLVVQTQRRRARP